MLLASGITVTHRTLAPVDLVIIAIYFVMVFGIGFYFSRKERTSEDYFLAGRKIGWFAIGASLFVSNISTEHFIGLAGSGATSGLAAGNFEWQASCILLLLGWVFVPFYLRSNVFTMPEFLERRFNRNCAMYLASISIIAYIFTKISVHLYAAAIVLERVVGWNQWTAAIILVIATGIYTIAGGLAAVIYTDLVQTLILLAGAIALTFIGLGKVGGFAHLREMVPASYFHMVKPISDPDFPWTGIFFGAPILGIWYWCTDQVIVQRVLSARDEGHAKAGTIFAGFLKILPVFLLVVPGIIAFALYPQLFTIVNGSVTNGDIAFPTAVVNLLPTGFVGLMIAALLAALMGAMSSVFNSASTMVTLDFYKKLRPRSQRKATRNLWAHRHGRDGPPWPALGSVHSRAQCAIVGLSAERSGVYQSADRGLLHIWNFMAAPEWTGSNLIIAGRIRSRRCALCARSVGQDHPLPVFRDPRAHRHQFSPLLDRDVHCVRAGADRGEHAFPGSGSKENRWAHLRDRGREARHGRRQDRAPCKRNAHGTSGEPRIYLCLDRDGAVSMDLLSLKVSGIVHNS